MLLYKSTNRRYKKMKLLRIERNKECHGRRGYGWNVRGITGTLHTTGTKRWCKNFLSDEGLDAENFEAEKLRCREIDDARLNEQNLLRR
jgi:hypothetical protein